MGRITLVGTAHGESGSCNQGELLRILEGIGPEVIFEEIRPTDFEATYRDPMTHTLEMRAIGRYLKVSSARQVPVDDYVIPDSFQSAMASLDEYVDSHNAEYGALMDEISRKKHLLGFRFLNSSDFQALNKRANESYERTIAMSGSKELKEKLLMWTEQIRRRDAAMVENIHAFCRTNPFSAGAFLVGAGHLSTILEEIEKTAAAGLAWQKLSA